MISTFLFWLHVAKQQEAYIKNLISENLKNKFNATYSLKTTGYPNRVDTTVSDIKIKSKTNKDLMTIKNLLIMSLIYNRKKYILSIEPAINIKIGTNLFEINEGDLNASIKYSNDKLINNFTFHATNIRSYINKKILITFEDLLFATRLEENYKNDFFLKLEKPIFENTLINHNQNFNYEFSFNDIKNLKLSYLLDYSDLFKRKINFNSGNIKIIETNVNLNNDLPIIQKYIKNLSLVNKNLILKSEKFSNYYCFRPKLGSAVSCPALIILLLIFRVLSKYFKR